MILQKREVWEFFNDEGELIGESSNVVKTISLDTIDSGDNRIPLESDIEDQVPPVDLTELHKSLMNF